MTGPKEIEALAEALWILSSSFEPGDWLHTTRSVRAAYRREANRLLKILGTLGTPLKIEAAA